MAVDFKQIGSRIQKRRKECGMTQETLAESLGVSVGYVSQIERGITKANLEMLGEICIRLQCDLASIVSGVVWEKEKTPEGDLLRQYETMSEREKRIVSALVAALIENR